MRDLPQSDWYGADPRDDVRPHVPTTARSALDVGCADGGFGRTLREVLGDSARVVGVDAVPRSAERARAAGGFDEVLDGYFPEALAGRSERFDLISFNDVLEHVLEPAEVLVAAREHLTPGGRVIAAIPSIQYAPVVLRLLKGRWDYADSGTLDRTHVRFFTRATMVELFEGAGFRVETCAGVSSLYETKWAGDPNRARRAAKRWVGRAMGDAAYLHFVLVGTPR